MISVPNRTFLVRFSGISAKSAQAMPVSLARTSPAKLPRARPFFGNIFLPFTVVSNKVFMSNNKSGRKLKFHCWQETEHYFSQETLQGLRYSTVSEILEVLCRGVYSNLGVGAREKF